tara:strand:+ start:1028 stop:1387 length:360 start_codon:yes stop_codon:yes gene_type:complete
MSYQISFHYRGVLLTVENMFEPKINKLEDKANECILTALQRGCPLNKQITVYKQQINETYNKIKNDEYVSRFNKRVASIIVFILIKLKKLENDDKNGYLFLKNKNKVYKIDPEWIRLRF